MLYTATWSMDSRTNLSSLILREENRFSRLSVYWSSNVFSQDLSKIQTSSYMYRMPISTKLCRIVPRCRSNDIKLIPLDRRIDVILPGDCSRRRNCTTSIYQAATRQEKSEKHQSSNIAFVFKASRDTLHCYDIKPVRTKEGKSYWKIPLGHDDATREK